MEEKPSQDEEQPNEWRPEREHQGEHGSAPAGRGDKVDHWAGEEGPPHRQDDEQGRPAACTRLNIDP